MYYSHMSGVNVGIITTIWGIQPIVAATFDLIINKEPIFFYHVVGMVLCIGSGLCISFADKVENHLINNEETSISDVKYDP